MKYLNHWSIRIILLSAVTFVGTMLSMLMNYPLGQISPFWIPTGISFAALLVGGRKLWPGIFLGVLSAHLYLNSVPTLDDIEQLIPLAFVALGETLGPYIAVLFVENRLRGIKRIYSERDFFLFLLFAGPISAIISAIIGISALHIYDIVAASTISTHAVNWIVGEACSGMIVGAITLIVSHSRSRNKIKLSKLAAPLVVLFLIVFVAFTWIHSVQQKIIANYAQNRSEVTSTMMEKDLRSFAQILSVIDSFITNSNSTNIRQFISTLDINRPGILAISQIKTSTNTRTEFLTAEHIFADRSAFFKNSEITSLIEDTQAKQKPLAKIIRNYIGLTSASESIILISYPTVDGMIVGFFNLDPIVDSAMSLLSDPSFHISIFGADYQQTLLADSSVDSLQQHEFIPTFLWRKTVPFYNIEIIFEFRKDFSLTATRVITNWLILIGSLLITFAIATVYLSLVTKFAVVNELVRDKTKYLEQANARLKENAREKSAFFASISHEIRTPLNILLGTNELLAATDLNKEQQEYIKINHKAGNSLHHLINDLLDLSKIEAGKLSLNNKPFNLKNELTECIQTFEYQLDEKGLKFELSYDNNLYDSYFGDPDRVKQVLSNLLSNAIKFTSSGTITVEVMTSKDPHTNISVAVTDTGIGISPENQQKLFKPFMQADASITRQFGGTGLGLSICKNICNMMGGDIYVESEVGRGSRFVFTLNLNQSPQRIVRKTAEEYQDAIQAQGALSILVVDDSSDNRMLVKAYLKSTPHQIYEAENGQEALDRVKEGGIDLVLMDMQMPVMDGYTATKAIRQWEQQEHLPKHEIWALTAYAMGHEIEKTKQAGCTNHLSKPLRRKELLKHIVSYGEKRKIDESHA